MLNSLKKKLNAALEGLNRLELATATDVQACLREVREILSLAEIGERDMERFIHDALDTFAGREGLSGHEAARLVQRDLKTALAHISGVRPLFDQTLPSNEVLDLRKFSGKYHPAAERRWCLKEFDNTLRREGHSPRFRQPAVERRIVGPVHLVSPEKARHARPLLNASNSQMDDRHTGPLDKQLMNKMIAKLRGKDDSGQDPPDIGNPALI